ncbi:MAG: lipase maturation factor family protein [Acidobacteriaceae bacterium]|nr:lipase maturation factor family protein [Acidobacteriaceae bacterium]MBV9778734.1 lipase maturation factor family protein [Acidobacteriaceae bacterium]
MEDLRGLWVTRLLLYRGLGVICLVAFLVALNQFRPLLGERGLLPVPILVKQVRFVQTPSLFYLFPRDAAFTTAAWLGILLSCLVITGVSERFGTLVSVCVWAAIYILYLSFVNVGQTFYGFGWESILLEACFFAMFLGASDVVPSRIPIWIFRWLLFRIMFGAGLIKLRGDPCWRDLTCLDYHYETQPMPNPLSWYFHLAPQWVNKGGVLFNHFSELIVPFFYFLPQPFAGGAGLITILFQLSIIASGNLSWLNWLTLFLAFSTIDGKFLSAVIALPTPPMHTPGRLFEGFHIAIAVLVAALSVPVVLNMLSARQIMNLNFNPLHLVGTYGAFGSITRPRYEVVVEGTDEPVITSGTRWREYEFKGKPGDVNRMPPQIAPYHLRLDWLMWFAAMSSYQDYPWFVNFVGKLLQNDAATLSLLRTNPFPQRPPRYVRALLYEYHFTSLEERKRTGAWWKRTLTRYYFPAVSLDTPGFRQILQEEGWLAAQ